MIPKKFVILVSVLFNFGLFPFTYSNTIDAGDYFIWTQKSALIPDNQQGYVVYVDISDQSYWGYLDVTVTGGYDWRNITGNITKRFEIGYNSSGVGSPGPYDSFWSNTSHLTVSMGNIKSAFKIGDMEATGNNKIRVPIYSLTGDGNKITVKVEGTNHVAMNLGSLSLSAPQDINHGITEPEEAVLDGVIEPKGGIPMLQ